jgi:hypothetical protein
MARNAFCMGSMNKMSPNVPGNIHPNRFYLEKTNYKKIRWPFIIRIIHLKFVMA